MRAYSGFVECLMSPQSPHNRLHRSSDIGCNEQLVDQGRAATCTDICYTQRCIMQVSLSTSRMLATSSPVLIGAGSASFATT